jgi:SEC-C motif
VWRVAGGGGSVQPVSTTERLTRKEIYDDATSSVNRGEDPAVVVARLEAIVDEGRHDEPLDAALILVTAAELAEHHGDLEGALRLADRATRATMPEGFHYPRALRASLLVRAGRKDEGRAELEAMRPLLLSDADVVPLVCETLEELGQVQLAVDWATEAFDTLRRQWTAPGALDAMAVSDSAVMVTLVETRHRLRHVLDLPHDEIDDLADELAHDHDDDGADDAVAVLVWREAEFRAGLVRWPAFAGAYGSWDTHRAEAERRLRRLSESGIATGLLIGSVDGLAAFAGSNDPMDADVRHQYADHLAGADQVWEWPPGRNVPCWCGSGQKYKRCCLPRSRG